MTGQEQTITIDYLCAAVSLSCANCQTPLYIERRSHAIISGVFCTCGEQYTMQWDEGILKRLQIEREDDHEL